MCCQCLVHANRFDLILHAVCCMPNLCKVCHGNSCAEQSSAVALRSASDSKMELQSWK